jgi:UDP-N-acetylmuramate dehydrogenase
MGLNCRAWAIAEAADIPHLLALRAYAQRHGRRMVLLGSGSNVVFASEHVDVMLVRLGSTFRGTEVCTRSATVRVGAGTYWRTVIRAAREANFGGLEYGWCIPGTMGGALAGNAGAAGRDCCNDVVSATVMTPDGSVRLLRQGDFSHSYRRSELHRYTILEAELKLEPSTPERVDELVEQMRAMRKSQPKVASSGCVFKNPAGTSAGRIIDECGLKGRRVGGLEVSPVHANFIVNVGGGSPEDFFQLVEEVRGVVRERTGHELEMEVRVIGG